MIFALLVCGGSLATAPPDQVASTQDLAAYEAAREKVGRSSEAHVELALWCEAHGLKAERLKHLALAVLLDPKSASARGLMGLVAYQGRWQRPDAVAEKVKADEALTAKLAEYNARRGRIRETADAHWDLAVWCERNGLDAEAETHFSVVTRLNPSREAAWKRLGCKKHDGRWMTDVQVTREKEEAELQKRADRHWKPLLTKWRGWLGDRARRAKAEESLAAVTDPRAAGAVWSVFVAGSPASHERAVQLLGQIDAQAASRSLAVLAIFDNSAEVRRLATETLRRRDPREFVGLLIGLLRKPFRYDVRPVNGPGSTGVLFVEGEQFNVQRLYSAPSLPSQVRLFTDDVPFVPFSPQNIAGAMEGYMIGGPEALSAPLRSSLIKPPHRVLHGTTTWVKSGPPLESLIPPNTLVRAFTDFARGRDLQIGRNMVEIQKAALASQRQLADDLAWIEATNAAILETNARAAEALKQVTGTDLSGDRDAWRAWWTDQLGYASSSQPESKPTYVENVRPYYVPQVDQSTSRPISYKMPNPVTDFSCFGAGTLVRTLTGSQPIETLKVGDLVLTQDIKTGALGYHPVTVIHHNPPSPTFLIRVGGETIVSSPFHRFWVVGKGWVMARDMRGGENLRLLDGPARVESVESGPAQLVYNLDVAGDNDFFAGTRGALVHDNTLPDTRLVPFDAARNLADITSAH